MNQNYLYSDLTEKIIGCAYTVWHKLGAGFLEKVYENALAIELRMQEIKVIQQYPIKVLYEKIVIGEYVADLFIEDKVIVELKVASDISKAHEAQLINYLKATDIEIGLLINFGDDIKIKRKIMQKSRIK